MTLRTFTSGLFLATVFCCTFEKLHWDVGSAVSIGDVLAIGFLVSYTVLTRPRVPRTTVVLLGFFAAFVVIYLTGFYNLETSDALAQFAKGFVAGHPAIVRYNIEQTAGGIFSWNDGVDYADLLSRSRLAPAVQALYSAADGDLDAGRGAKTTLSQPPLQVMFDANDYQSIDLGGDTAVGVQLTILSRSEELWIGR